MKNDLNFGPYHDWDRTVPPPPITDPAGAAPILVNETRYTVTCSTVGCPNRDAGPWRILGGVANETYHCARCGQLMAFTVGWDDWAEVDE